MRQIAAGRAIARGYQFLFRELPTVLALSWVGALFYAGLRLWLTAPEFAAPQAPLWLALAARLALLLGAALLTSAIAVSLTRSALGYSSPFLLAHLTIGQRELALFWAQICVYLAVVGMAVGSGFVIAGAAKAAAALMAAYPSVAHWPLAAMASFAASVLCLCTSAYVALRLSMLLYPAATAEDGPLLSRSWALGRGQVTALLLIALGIFIPIGLINLAFDYAVFGPAFPDAVRSLLNGQTVPVSLDMLLARAPVAMTVAATLSLVALAALQAGASAEAYLALTEEHLVPAAQAGLAPEHEPAAVYETTAAAHAEAAATFDVPAPVFAAPATLIGDPFAAPMHQPVALADITSHDGAYEVQAPATLSEPAFLAAPAPYGETAAADIAAAPQNEPLPPAATASYANYEGWAAPGVIIATPRAARAEAVPAAGPEHEELDISALPEDWNNGAAAAYEAEASHAAAAPEHYTAGVTGG